MEREMEMEIEMQMETEIMEKVLHMNGGVGQYSYANNSLVQRAAVIKAKPILEESIKEVYHALKPKCLMMADMGCSSGPNALFVVSEVVNIIEEVCKSLNNEPPQFGVFFNDLPGNDFNTLFSFVQGFQKGIEEEKGSNFGPCFVSATPRSFYGRVLPNHFLHFVHSAYALQWLSQVPEGLVSKEGVALNKGNIYIAKTSPPEVHQAYYSQFKRDFTLFLRSRAREVVPGGCMVFTALGNIKSTDPSPMHELLGFALYDMVLEGIIKEEKLNKFNMPMYLATAEEARQLIEAEGSFVVNRLETFTIDWSVDITQNLNSRAKFVMETVRAAYETLLSRAFGEAIIDELFIRFKKRVHKHFESQTGEYLSILVSLTKRA